MTARTPDFLIIGAQKAGTSWLHRRLRQHPAIYLPEDKDFEHFSFVPYPDEDRWRARFADAGPGQRIGDACASYFWTGEFGEGNVGFNPDIPGTIRDALGPDTRILILLRDPVARAVSAYLHHIAFGSLDARVPLLAAPGALGLVALSRYGMHLDNWLSAFPERAIRVLPSPGEAEPRAVLGPACAHLGVEPRFVDGSNQAVFPGLLRKRTEDGIWAALDQPGLDRPVGPVREIDGRQWTRLIDPGELTELTDSLRDDTRRLAGTLARIEQTQPAFRAWSTWPAPRGAE